MSSGGDLGDKYYAMNATLTCDRQILLFWHRIHSLTRLWNQHLRASNLPHRELETVPVPEGACCPGRVKAGAVETGWVGWEGHRETPTVGHSARPQRTRKASSCGERCTSPPIPELERTTELRRRQKQGAEGWVLLEGAAGRENAHSRTLEPLSEVGASTARAPGRKGKVRGGQQAQTAQGWKPSLGV